MTTAAIGSNNIDPNDPHHKNQGGSGQKVNGNTLQSISGTPWKYEQWSEGGTSASMTYYSNGNFKANWVNCSDYLARVGFRYDPRGIDYRTKNYIADYQYTKSGSAGYGYIGAYGWTKDPIVEFYIIDDWYGSQPSRPEFMEKGKLTVDGATYTIYTCQRVNAPTPFSSEHQMFLQFLSVRSSARQQGRIHISTHLEKWTSLGMQLGKLTEVSLLTEAGGNASGSIEYTYFNLMDLQVE